MANKRNPDLIGLTEKEKKAYYARQYRANNKQHMREYIKNYRRVYTKSAENALARVQRDITALEQKIEAIKQAYADRLIPIDTKLQELNNKKMQLEQVVAQNQLLPQARQVRVIFEGQANGA